MITFYDDNGTAQAIPAFSKSAGGNTVYGLNENAWACGRSRPGTYGAVTGTDDRVYFGEKNSDGSYCLVAACSSDAVKKKNPALLDLLSPDKPHTVYFSLRSSTKGTLERIEGLDARTTFPFKHANGTAQAIPAFPKSGGGGGNPVYGLGENAWAPRTSRSGTYGAVTGTDDRVYFGEKNSDGSYCLVAACSAEAVRKKNPELLGLLSPDQPHTVSLSLTSPERGTLNRIEGLDACMTFPFRHANGTAQAIPAFPPPGGGNPVYWLGENAWATGKSRSGTYGAVTGTDDRVYFGEKNSDGSYCLVAACSAEAVRKKNPALLGLLSPDQPHTVHLSLGSGTLRKIDEVDLDACTTFPFKHADGTAQAIPAFPPPGGGNPVYGLSESGWASDTSHPGTYGAVTGMDGKVYFGEKNPDGSYCLVAACSAEAVEKKNPALLGLLSPDQPHTVHLSLISFERGTLNRIEGLDASTTFPFKHADGTAQTIPAFPKSTGGNPVYWLGENAWATGKSRSGTYGAVTGTDDRVYFGEKNSDGSYCLVAACSAEAVRKKNPELLGLLSPDQPHTVSLSLGSGTLRKIEGADLDACTTFPFRHADGTAQAIPAFPPPGDGNPVYVLGENAWAPRKSRSGTYGAVTGTDDRVYFGKKNSDGSYCLVAACSAEAVRKKNPELLGLLSPDQPHTIHLSFKNGTPQRIEGLDACTTFPFRHADGTAQAIPAFPPPGDGNPVYVLGENAWAPRKSRSGTYGAVTGTDDRVYFGEKNSDESYCLVAACPSDAVKKKNPALLKLLSPDQPHTVSFSLNSGVLQSVQTTIASDQSHTYQEKACQIGVAGSPAASSMIMPLDAEIAATLKGKAPACAAPSFEHDSPRSSSPSSTEASRQTFQPEQGVPTSSADAASSQPCPSVEQCGQAGFSADLGTVWYAEPGSSGIDEAISIGEDAPFVGNAGNDSMPLTDDSNLLLLLPSLIPRKRPAVEAADKEELRGKRQMLSSSVNAPPSTSQDIDHEAPHESSRDDGLVSNVDTGGEFDPGRSTSTILLGPGALSYGVREFATSINVTALPRSDSVKRAAGVSAEITHDTDRLSESSIDGVSGGHRCNSLQKMSPRIQEEDQLESSVDDAFFDLINIEMTAEAGDGSFNFETRREQQIAAATSNRQPARVSSIQYPLSPEQKRMPSNQDRSCSR